MRPSIRWFIVAFVAAAACKGTEPFVPVATTVTVTPGTISFTAVGAAQTLAATVLDQRDNAMPNATVTWSTNNPSVATVGGTGIVTSTGNGSAQITATSGLATGHANVDVAQVSSALLKWNGDGQTGSVGTALPTALTAKLIDGYGSPIAGVAVTWMTITGSLSTPGGTITDGNGLVSANWTLGTTSGSQQATVTGGGETAAFTATANAGPPASVVVQAGDSQRAAQSTPVPVPPAVRVRDQYSNLVAGAAVAFAVGSGGGSVTGANPATNGGGSVTGDTMTTGTSGIATVGSWTVQLGPNTLGASIPDAGVTNNPLSFTATGAAPDYDISIRPLTTMSPSRRAVFDSAAAHWERLIYGDVPDIPLNIPGDTLKKYCTGRTTPTLNETVDDIVIYAILDSIDGPGKVLGRAGPCYIRSSGFQPVIGVMFFDTADVASFPFDVVVTHEMGHVIGFGTI